MQVCFRFQIVGKADVVMSHNGIPLAHALAQVVQVTFVLSVAIRRNGKVCRKAGETVQSLEH